MPEIVEAVISDQTVLINVAFYVLAMMDEYGLLYEPNLAASFFASEQVQKEKKSNRNYGKMQA